MKRAAVTLDWQSALTLTANTVNKSLIAFQSGGWRYASVVSGGVWLTTAAVWLGYFAQKAGLGF